MVHAGLICERKHGKIYGSTPWNYYEISYPKISDEEKELVSEIARIASHDYTSSEIRSIFEQNKKKAKLIENVKKVLKKLKPYQYKILEPEAEREVIKIVREFLNQAAPNMRHKSEVAYYVIQELVGFGKIAFLLDDDELEEIIINGSEKPVFVFDRKNGLCETSLKYDSDEEIMSLIKKTAAFVSKKVGKEHPLLDARLPDGSRINATIPPASPNSLTFTVRKFRKRPMTVAELIDNGTMTSEAMALLWMCVEGFHIYPLNFLIVGGAGSGKTTTLNALTVFMPLHERIITIEDTLELNLFDRENWVQLESRPGPQGELTMDDLLKNAIRMRPDRIIVGEVRGSEAETMFVAMDVGHQGTMGTLHANTARETLTRLQNAPMNVPPSLFSLLDMIVMQHRIYGPDGLVRRITQISEVSVMEERVLLNDVYTFNRQKQAVQRSELPSQVFERFAFYTGLSKQDIKRELRNRALILDNLVENKIFDYLRIRDTVTQYYKDPDKVLSKL
jgi:flagellar protein FlaI